MPIYEYKCTACSHELEALQKISDQPLVDCPECGQPSLKKLLSAAGFRLKGSGWYETDFKAGKKKNLHDTGHGDKAKAASAGDDKSPAKVKKPDAPTKGTGGAKTSASGS